MDVWKTLLVALLVAALLGGDLARPRRAAAMDAATTGAIVGAAVGGLVALITLIAIIGAKRDDPEVMPLLQRDAARRREGAGPSWGPRCRPNGPNLTLLCW